MAKILQRKECILSEILTKSLLLQCLHLSSIFSRIITITLTIAELVILKQAHYGNNPLLLFLEIQAHLRNRKNAAFQMRPSIFSTADSYLSAFCTCAFQSYFSIGLSNMPNQLLIQFVIISITS